MKMSESPEHNRLPTRALIALALLILPAFEQSCAKAADEPATVWLSSLDLSRMTSGWGRPRVDKSVQDRTMSIAGRKFERGVGTHADSIMYIDLKGGSTRFTAHVGVDDEINGNIGSIEFKIYGDKRLLWQSGVIKAGEPAKKVDVDLAGLKALILMVGSAGDGISYDHADWAEAKFEVTGEKPVALEAPVEEAVILTPKPSPKPRINGARVFGVRPGSPFLFTVAATGERPMEFSAEGLPVGLTLDSKTGRITGSLSRRGQYQVILRAVNALGAVERDFRIVVGDRLALTPPMGWNSWYCFFSSVTDKMMRDAADAMVQTGMINHGYTYVNIDDGWMVKPGSDDPVLGGPVTNSEGQINANGKFPDMKAMTDYIHGKGLKAGLYTSPGPTTCAGFAGSYGHEEQDARRFAEWGFDFLKYDWCSYRRIAKDRSRAELMKPYLVMKAALDKQDRDFIYNLCQYGMGNVWEWGAEVGGHCWRTTGDLGIASSLYRNVINYGFFHAGKEQYAGPGHWNDPDYLLIGHIGWRGSLRPTPLTPNEQYTHVSLWCLLAAPLIFSGDMTKLDEFTLSLLTNDEVIEIDQDPLGRQASRVAQAGETQVWAKDMEDGSKAVGLFNTGEFETKVAARWSDLGVRGKQRVRDLWRQKDIGIFEKEFETDVPRHGVVLVRLFPTRAVAPPAR
ncbi:MAG: NPCBM/NEW2 domain-containing protein [Phycisphaerales bacterium]|nr:MAG: NPCBM/NEW2 domain-containing protein [Phycisphaerales bacterium]